MGSLGTRVELSTWPIGHWFEPAWSETLPPIPCKCWMLPTALFISNSL